MAKRQALEVKVRITGVRETLAAFRDLPKDASKSLRERTLELSESLAGKVRGAAVSEGAQAALMAPTVKANRDRVPSLTAGGVKRVGRYRVPAHKLLFASEFGMNRRTGWFAAERFDSSIGRQFRPHIGRGSYWFFKTVEAEQSEINTAWNKVAADIQREFGHGA